MNRTIFNEQPRSASQGYSNPLASSGEPSFEPPPLPTDADLGVHHQQEVAHEAARREASNQPANQSHDPNTAIRIAVARQGKVLVSRSVEIATRISLLLLLVILGGLVAWGWTTDGLNYLHHGYPRETRYEAKLNLSSKFYQKNPDGTDKWSGVRIKNNLGCIQAQVDPVGVITSTLYTRDCRYLGADQDKTSVDGRICQGVGKDFPHLQISINGKLDFVVNDGQSIRWAKADERADLIKNCVERPDLWRQQ